MDRKALGKHGWSVCLGLLLSAAPGGYVLAAPKAVGPQLAIGSPLANSLVGGRITLSVAYQQAADQIVALTVYVDDKIHQSRNLNDGGARGIQYVELDTRTLEDGNHTLRVVAVGRNGILAADEVNITVRNGIAGGPDLVPPLVQLRDLVPGDVRAGKFTVEVLAEDNTTMDLLVSLFVNKQPRLIKNHPPYTLELNAADFLNPNTGEGSITLEAWAYDKANNLGKSRPITLRVVPEGVQNATPKQDDPTQAAPVTPDPQLPSGLAVDPEVNLMNAPEALRPAMQSELVIALPGRDTAPSPSTPRNLTPEPPVGTGLEAASGTASPIAAPELAPASRQLADAKTREPIGSRLRMPAAEQIASARLPALPAGGIPAPLLSGVREQGRLADEDFRTARPSGERSQSPDGGPLVAEPLMSQPKPLMMAPEAMVDLPGELPELEDAVGAPRATEPRPARSMEAEAPQVEVRLGVRPEPVDPARRVALAAPIPTMPNLPEERMVAVIDAGQRRNDGRLPVELHRTGPDRNRRYQVQAGDTVEAIARKFQVTPKSIRVANGIKDSGKPRRGSVLQVPGSFDVVLNDQRIAFDVAPRIDNGMALAPLRQIIENAGGTLAWHPESREVLASTGKREIKLRIGSKEVLVNDVVVLVDREVFIDRGRTMVPISFLEEVLDLKAEYDVRNRTIALVRR